MYIVTPLRQKRKYVARLICKEISFFVYQITEDEFKIYSDDEIFIVADKVIEYLDKLKDIFK